MEKGVSRLELALLGAAILVGLAIRLHFYTGLMASDDLVHGYAAAHFFHPPPPDIEHVAGLSTNARRIGVNLPLFLAGKVGGFGATTYSMVPLLFSLAGIAIVFGVGRRLGGPLAGCTAAWLWALLPADVYMATVWLQDNIYATVLIAFLALFVAAELGTRRRRLLAFGAGLLLGYLPFVKSSGFLLGLPMVVWVVWTCVRARRVEARVIALAAGFAVTSLLAMTYFWAVLGEPLYYVTSTGSRWIYLATKFHAPRAFPANWEMLGHYLFGDWVFGYSLVAVPILFAFALATRRLPVLLRVFLALVFLVQLWALTSALVLGSWTQRYVLQISAPVVLLGAVGLAEAVERCGPWLVRLPSRMRPAVGPAAAAILVLATGTALSAERQQFRHERAVNLTNAYHYLEAVAAPDEHIYIAQSRRVPNYTLRALELLNGYRRFKGGLRPLDEAYSATGGWVVLDHLDFVHRPKDEMYRGIPPNWLEVFRSDTHHGHFYARVFRILRAAPPVTVNVIRGRDTPPALDLSTLPLSPVPLDGPADAFLGKRWTHGADVTLRRSAQGDGIVESIHPTCKKHKRAFSALRLPVRGLDAIAFDLSLSDPARVHKVFVYAYDAQDKGSLRWWARRPRHGERKGYPRHVVLVDGEHSPPFVHQADSTRPAEVRSVVIGVWLDGCAPAEVEIGNVEVAPPTGPRLPAHDPTMAPSPLPPPTPR